MSEEKKQFKPEDLQTGDHFWRVGHERKVLYVHRNGILANFVYPTEPSSQGPGFLNYRYSFRDSGNEITVVQRSDTSGKLVQIWPRPECPFKVGDRVRHPEAPVDRTVTISRIYWEEDHWRLKGKGLDGGTVDAPAASFALAPPEPKFKKDDRVDTKDSARMDACWPATITETRFLEGEWEHIVQYRTGHSGKGCWWGDADMFAAPPESPWQPEVYDTVSHEVLGLGWVRTVEPDCIRVAFRTTVPDVIFQRCYGDAGHAYHGPHGVRELKPHAPPLDEVQGIIHDALLEDSWQEAELATIALNRNFIFIRKGIHDEQTARHSDAS